MKIGKFATTIAVAFLLSCNKESKDAPNDKDPRSPDSAYRPKPPTLDPQSASNARLEEWHARLGALGTEELQLEIALLLRERSVSRRQLFDYAMDGAPDVSRATILSLLAQSAGEEGDMETLRLFFEINPGKTKEVALTSFARSLTSHDDIIKFIEIFPNEAFPEEVDAICRAVAGPLSALDAGSIKGLLNQSSLPKGLSYFLASRYGETLSELDTQAARAKILELPESSQGVAIASYWSAVARKDIDRVQSTWKNNEIPEPQKFVVGKSLIDSIYRKSSREAAIDFALNSGSPELGKQLTTYAFGQWVRQDSIAASDAASKLQPGLHKDGAAEAIAAYLDSIGAKEDARIWRGSKSGEK